MSTLIRAIVLATIVTSLAYLPVYATQTLVMPGLEAMQDSYAHAGETAEALFAQK